MGIARAAAFVAALLCGAFAVYLLARRPRRAPALDRHRAGAGRRAAARRAVHAAPARACATPPRPWFFTNDSTYQVELGGELLLDLDNPYGHDYRESGLERFYTRDGSVSERVREREVALRALRLLPGRRV